MSIRDLEERLSSARERFQRAAKAIAPRHKGGEWEEYWSNHEAVLRLERELAAARGEEHAVPLDFPVRWDAGAPLPHLLRNDCRCLLTFYVREHDPAWDGTYVTVKAPGSGDAESLALVEFAGCVSAKLGSPNDEVFEGHPLSGKGLDGYTAQEVLNSRWLAELEAVNTRPPVLRPGLLATAASLRLLVPRHDVRVRRGVVPGRAAPREHGRPARPCLPEAPRVTRHPLPGGDSAD